MTAAGGKPGLALAFVGGLRVTIDGAPLAIPKQKAQALLALLAMSAPHRVSRALLRGLLWSDSTEADAQNSLRNALWLLRKLLEDGGYAGLGSNRTELWLEPGSYTLDLDACRDSLAAGEVPRALTEDPRFPATVLAGIGATDLFDERLANYRTQLAADFAVAAASALDTAPEDRRIDLAMLLVRLEPLNEAHCRTLLQLLAAQGRKADALAVYQRLWTLLDDEYGEEPSAETQAIIVALKQEETGTAAAQPTTPEASLPVIVVGHADRADLTPLGRARLEDAVQLSLSALARFREWRVIDGRYVQDRAALLARYGGQVFDLGLTPRNGGGPVETIGTMLTDLRSGQVVWSDVLEWSFAVRPDDLDRVVRRFATAINLFLTGPGRPHPEGPDPMDHYALWLEAQQKMRAFTHRGWREAEALLERILSENPQHVRALAARSSIETMRQITFPGTTSTPEMHRRALKWSSTAVMADPMDARAQLAMAWAAAMARSFERAELAFELAFQHNENDPWIIASATAGFAFCGQTERAARLVAYLADLGLDLEPFHWTYLATAQFLLGDDEACIAMSERAAEIVCDIPAWHAAALAHAGRLDEARQVAGRFLTLTRAQWVHPRPPTDAEITGWVLSCFPIRARRHWLRLRDGLVRAGLPVPG